jgi:pyruvate/2-oxoglutarate dehydrogenase complex dihydrolipoamide dehydrogenase (E3) component
LALFGVEMVESKTYDLAIIGSGSGRLRGRGPRRSTRPFGSDDRADSRLGGVCTLRGCIPTKALLHTADLLEEARHGADVGVAAREVRLDLPGAMKHKEKVVRQSSNGVAYLMKKNRVDVANGFGRIAGVGRVSVTGADGAETVYSVKNILVATGSVPKALPGIEIDHKTILSSDSILELTEVPKSLLVIGSGAVGVEFASMYARFGSKTTILEVLPRIVPVEDEDISRELAASFKRQGMTVYVDARVERVTKTEGRRRGARADLGREDGNHARREGPPRRRPQAALGGDRDSKASGWRPSADTSASTDTCRRTSRASTRSATSCRRPGSRTSLRRKGSWPSSTWPESPR